MTFQTSLISNALQAGLPFHFELRPLKIDDWEKGFLPCLGELTVVGKVSKQAFTEQFLKLTSTKEYFICVIEDVRDGSIAAAGTLFVEEKFIHMNGKVGHVEDIVVRKRYRGMNLGKFIIEQLKHIGKEVGCYKVILDCSSSNVPFYEKCAFKVKEKQMVIYFEENDASATAKQQLSRL